MKTLFFFIFAISLSIQAHAQFLPENFSAVTTQVFRGARPTDANEVQILHQNGIRTIIDLQGGDAKTENGGWFLPFFEQGETPAEIQQERSDAAKAGIAFYNTPLSSFGDFTLEEAQQLQTALKLMSNPVLQPVYVHCAFGVDRTGLVIALYRVLYQNWPAEKAYQEMYDKGHQGIHLVTYKMDQTFWSIVALRNLH